MWEWLCVMSSSSCPTTARTTRTTWNVPRSHPRRGLHRGRRGVRAEAQVPEDGEPKLTDPEAKFRRYGKFFGGNYWVAKDFLNSAPRVRFRKSVDRGVDQLSELAILNERLAGGKSWEIRRKVITNLIFESALKKLWTDSAMSAVVNMPIQSSAVLSKIVNMTKLGCLCIGGISQK